MANCSIPNSTPAIGRTSPPLSRRSRKQNSASASFFAALSLTITTRPRTLSFFNAQLRKHSRARRSTPNARRSIQTVGRWTLSVERWALNSRGGEDRNRTYPATCATTTVLKTARATRHPSLSRKKKMSNVQRPTSNFQLSELSVER